MAWCFSKTTCPYMHGGGSFYLFHCDSDFIDVSESDQRILPDQVDQYQHHQCLRSRSTFPGTVRQDGWANRGKFLGGSGFLCGPNASIRASTGFYWRGRTHHTTPKAQGSHTSTKPAPPSYSDRAPTTLPATSSRSLSALASTRCESVRRPVEDTDSARVGLVPPPCTLHLALAEDACNLPFLFSL